MRKTLPENIRKYFDLLFEGLTGTRLIVALDPNRLLKLEDTYIDSDGKSWQVYRYCENDFSFRREYSQKPTDPNFAHIVWVTNPSGKHQEKINLSYIPDILEKAEEIFDLRIDNILKKLLPRETWPPEETLFAHEKEIASNLGTFITKTKEFRKVIGPSIPLNKSHILGIVLASNNETLPLKDLVFEITKPEDLLYRYVSLIYTYDFDTQDKQTWTNLVKENARVDAKNILPCLDIEREDLAVFFYVFEIFSNYDVRNLINQMKGLGILGFEPTAWGNYASEILPDLRKHKEIWKKVVCLAEDILPEGVVNRIIKCLPLEIKEQISYAVERDSSPLFIYGLLIALLKKVLEDKDWKGKEKFVISNLKTHPLSQEDAPQSKYLSDARALLSFFIEMAFIRETLGKDFNPKNELASVLKWYETNEIYRLEFCLTKVIRSIKVIGDRELRETLNKYLNSYIKFQIEQYLERFDLYLFNIIEKNIKEHFLHPRLSINMIRDCIIKEGFEPSNKSRLWLLVFDGMRLDTWKEIVKPCLAEKFEILEEDLYLCPLPSVTDVARISLLAGKLPSEWQDYRGRFTSDHNILASKLFNLSSDEGREKLRIVVASETDYGQRKLDLDIKPYNILIYNLSDDWIHTFKSDLQQLNETIRGNLIRDVLPDLEGRIGENDRILVTSDHGFVELSRENEIKVKAKDQTQIVYRYLKNIEHSRGLKVQYKSDEFYTVSKGRVWFGRERGRFSRYSHGGVSLAEMVVPAVVLKKSGIAIVEFEISKFPKEVEVLEDSLVSVEAGVKNIGNREETFEFFFELDSGERKSFRHKLRPLGEKILSFEFKPTLRNKRIEIRLTYKNAKKKQIKKTGAIQIKVIGRKEKVEFGLSALDRIDEVLKGKE